MESLERRTPPVARESRELRVLRFELAKPFLDHQLQQPLDYRRGLSEALQSARHEASLIGLARAGTMNGPRPSSTR
jgi:hypothetical protein